MVSEWSEWSECNKSCGRGHALRTRMVKLEPQFGGRPCPEAVQRRKCKMRRCSRGDDQRNTGGADRGRGEGGGGGGGGGGGVGGGGAGRGWCGGEGGGWADPGGGWGGGRPEGGGGALREWERERERL